MPHLNTKVRDQDQPEMWDGENVPMHPRGRDAVGGR
jgi:hypothetical protein